MKTNQPRVIPREAFRDILNSHRLKLDSIKNNAIKKYGITNDELATIEDWVYKTLNKFPNDPMESIGRVYKKKELMR